MPRATPFRLNRSGLLLTLLSAAFAGQAAASTAGRVDFAFGGATLTGSDGQRRPLARGTEVNSGDVVHTNDGRVQMRMKDGAYISLQPNTEFGIKSYSFEGKTDGTENAFYSLLKGAMRTVTGLIGRVNRNRYQVATPTATVGIRGTGGLIQVLNDGSTLVQGTSGIWFLANPAGSIDIPAGVSGLAPVDPKQPPKETVQIPTAGPSPLPALIEFVQGNERENDGKNVITGGVLASGSGYFSALAYGIGCDGPCPVIDAGVGSAVFNGSGQMTQFVFDGRITQIASLDSGGSHADFGTDGILAWGRWIGDTTTPSFDAVNFPASSGVHYVVGIPTATANMPQSGSATYTLIGSTRPTFVDGGNSSGVGQLTSGQLTISNWTSAQVGVNLNITMPGSKNYSIGGIADISGNTFTGNGQTGLGGSCPGSSCSASVSGFFAGTNAERAGLGYQIDDFNNGDRVVGAAAFTKQ
jgi:FecR protein